MAEVAIVTTVPLINDRTHGFGATSLADLSFQANTSEHIEYIQAPCSGVLKACYIQGSVTSDATKTYTITVTNKSNSDAAMLGTTLYDADPVLTAFTVAAATLSTTAANLAVDRGDMIAVSHTGGTGSGAVAIQLVFEIA